MKHRSVARFLNNGGLTLWQIGAYERLSLSSGWMPVTGGIGTEPLSPRTFAERRAYDINTSSIVP